MDLVGWEDGAWADDSWISFAWGSEAAALPGGSSKGAAPSAMSTERYLKDRQRRLQAREAARRPQEPENNPAVAFETADEPLPPENLRAALLAQLRREIGASRADILIGEIEGLASERIGAHQFATRARVEAAALAVLLMAA